MHGGLITYIHDDFTFKELNDMLPISGTSTLFESLFIKIWEKNSHHQKYVIGNIYRLPVYVADDLNLFINEFTDLLIVLRARSKSVYLCGDYNIDLIKINTNDNFNLFYENVISSSFIPNITLPTRMCDTTSTLIDNIYTNDNIYNKLLKNLNTNPNYNYEIVLKHLLNAKLKHIPKKVKKFNKRRHLKKNG